MGLEVTTLSDQEQAVLHRVPKKGKRSLKSPDISREIPKARYILRKLYDKGYVDRRLVGNTYRYFLTDKGEIVTKRKDKKAELQELSFKMPQDQK